MHALNAYRAQAKQLTDREGRTFAGFLAEPTGRREGAVLVVHDFFGLSPLVRLEARRLAREGFVTFAPDLYRGRVAATREEAIELAKRLAWNMVAKELGLLTSVLQQTYGEKRVGIVGFAMGGAAALVAAAAVPALSAAVSFYGIPQDVVIDNPRIAIQGHFARRDAKCSDARVVELEGALAAQRVSAEIHRYDADNGFMSPARPEVYDEAKAGLAWDRTLAFFNRTLR